jgi:hypothetical protein
MLQSVSTAEAGFYKCVSKGLTDPSFNIQGVELVVKRDWEDVWETDKEVSCFNKLLSCYFLVTLMYTMQHENCLVYLKLLCNVILLLRMGN